MNETIASGQNVFLDFCTDVIIKLDVWSQVSEIMNNLNFVFSNFLLVRITCMVLLSYMFMPLAAFCKFQVNFHNMLQDMRLNTVFHELEEISSLHKYEISFIM